MWGIRLPLFGRSKLFREDEVRAGIKLLDKERPGWRDRIDWDRLNLGSGEWCIVGQLSSCCYNCEVSDLFDGNLFRPIAHGFQLGGEPGNYRELTDTWKRLAGAPVEKARKPQLV